MNSESTVEGVPPDAEALLEQSPYHRSRLADPDGTTTQVRQVLEAMLDRTFEGTPGESGETITKRPRIEEALLNFDRDINEWELGRGPLFGHDDEWVAYHGSKVVGFSPSQESLFDACRRMGIDVRSDLFVGLVQERAELDC